MERLPEFVENVVGDVHDVVDRAKSDGLELAGQEVRTEVIRLLAPPPAAPNQELR